MDKKDKKNIKDDSDELSEEDVADNKKRIATDKKSPVLIKKKKTEAQEPKKSDSDSEEEEKLPTNKPAKQESDDSESDQPNTKKEQPKKADAKKPAEDSDDDKEESKKADNKKESQGEDDKVELFVGNLPFTVNDDMIGDFFSTYGKVINIKLLTNPDGRPKGIGFVKFENHDDCAKALAAANGAMFEGRPLRVNYSGDKPSGGPAGGAQRNAKNDQTVFVGNIPFSATKESLSEFFKECGEVSDVRIPVRDDGKLKGFCHVEFSSSDAAQKALKMNGNEFEGRELRIDTAGGRSSAPSHGGFSGGNRRGGRGGRGGPRRPRGGY